MFLNSIPLSLLTTLPPFPNCHFITFPSLRPCHLTILPPFLPCNLASYTLPSHIVTPLHSHTCPIFLDHHCPIFPGSPPSQRLVDTWQGKGKHVWLIVRQPLMKAGWWEAPLTLRDLAEAISINFNSTLAIFSENSKHVKVNFKEK